MIGVSMSIRTNGPLFEQRDPATIERSAMVYKIAASMITRITLVVMTFVLAREIETLRSIFQMRYASNPELDKFAASVKPQNAPMHSIVTSVEMIPVLLVCESP